MSSTDIDMFWSVYMYVRGDCGSQHIVVGRPIDLPMNPKVKVRIPLSAPPTLLKMRLHDTQKWTVDPDLQLVKASIDHHGNWVLWVLSLRVFEWFNVDIDLRQFA